jgi:YkoY family integral membrane protein
MEQAIINQVMGELHAFGAMDFVTVGTLAVLEGILSVDNALVLAILVRTLPKHQQKKALTYGIAGAFAFRLIAIVFAAHLMRLMVFKLIGGAYLVYLAMKHMFFFYKEDAYRPAPRAVPGFWKMVGLVELTDVAFSIDSITTAVAMTNKLIVVWLGGILGIIFLRFAASFFVRLLEKLPRLEDLAYRDYHQRKTHNTFQERFIERVRKGEAQLDELIGMDSVPGELVEYLAENGYIRLEGVHGRDKTGTD